MSNRNREAGHRLERKVRKDLEEILKSSVYTSRQTNRLADAKGLDLQFEEDQPFDIQCKSSSQKSIPIRKILDHMVTDKHKVVITQLTEKNGNRFYEKDLIVTLPYEFLTELLTSWVKTKQS